MCRVQLSGVTIAIFNIPVLSTALTINGSSSFFVDNFKEFVAEILTHGHNVSQALERFFLFSRKLMQLCGLAAGPERDHRYALPAEKWTRLLNSFGGHSGEKPGMSPFPSRYTKPRLYSLGLKLLRFGKTSSKLLTPNH